MVLFLDFQFYSIDVYIYPMPVPHNLMLPDIKIIAALCVISIFFSNTIKDFLLSLIFCKFTVKCLCVAHNLNPVWFWEHQFSSVAQSCPALCDPMNRSTPGLPVHHQIPEFTHTHVHRVSDAIQPSHPLSSPSPPAPNPSQHQSLFQ